MSAIKFPATITFSFEGNSTRINDFVGLDTEEMRILKDMYERRLKKIERDEMSKNSITYLMGREIVDSINTAIAKREEMPNRKGYTTH